MGATYREIVVWTSEMNRVRGCYNLIERHFSHPQRCTGRSRGSHVGIARFPSGVSEHQRSGIAGVIDATFFDRDTVSRNYQHRSDRHISMLKTMVLIDTDPCTDLDIYYSAHWPHDTQTERRISLRKRRKLRVSTATKAMTTTRFGTPPLRRRLALAAPPPVAAYDHAHKPVGQRIIRPALDGHDLLFGHQGLIGPAVQHRAWYRELVLTASVYNLEQTFSKSDPNAVIGFNKAKSLILEQSPCARKRECWNVVDRPPSR